MKSVSQGLFSLCLAVILVSCTFPMQPTHPDTKKDKLTIKQYIADKQFGRAIKLLEKRARKKPTRFNKVRLQKVRNIARKFENKVISKSQHKIKQNDWQSAFVMLDDALHQYPNSTKLNRYRHLITRQQTKNIKLAHIRLVAAKSDYLLRVKPIYAELNRLDPTDSDIQWKLRKTNIEISETAKSLHVSGRVEMNENQYETALKYLELAHQLSPTRKNTQALANLVRLRKNRLEKVRQRTQSQIRALANKPMSNTQRSQQFQLKKLKNRITHHLKYGNYGKAKNLLSKADHISPLHPEVIHPDIIKLRSEMYDSVNRKVNDLIHIGNEEYSKGKIEQAKKSWSGALKLDPNNKQIKNSVERADRVLSKLQEIKKQKTH